MTVPPESDVVQGWRKSSFSGQQGDCVEVQDLADGSRHVRHSEHPTGPSLGFTRSEWVAFIAGVKAGEFD